MIVMIRSCASPWGLRTRTKLYDAILYYTVPCYAMLCYVMLCHNTFTIYFILYTLYYILYFNIT